MEITVLADGIPVLTTQQAAEARGITRAGMRAILCQNHVDPIAHLDQRTPLYSVEALEALNPPGRGAYRQTDTCPTRDAS